MDDAWQVFFAAQVGASAALLAAGLSLAALGLSVSRGAWRSPATSRRNIAFGFAKSQLAAPPYVAAAVVLPAGGAGARGWVAAAMILSTAKAVADARALLVEINR
jgi:hypothetical protein